MTDSDAPRGSTFHNSVRFEVKNRFSLALAALIIFSLAVPLFVFAQQPNQPGSSAGRTTGKTEAPAPAPNRRTRARTNTATTAAITQDFDEALNVVRDNYIEGNKLDYNNVYKSSIIGMLRVLDPQAND